MVDHSNYKEISVQGRYVTLEKLDSEWMKKIEKSELTIVGHSVENLAIPMITLGKGPKKVLMWSQMHGNESTTTKSVLDLVNFLKSEGKSTFHILDRCTLFIIPILNPDGAKRYTRINANEVDLNRDAKQLTQPESRVLNRVFKDVQPNYCFNLHGQRTLFSAGGDSKPATLSFLSPASDYSRKLTRSRETAMRLIVAMNQLLQQYIPGQVGRYDDTFNDNCVGDAFQMENIPTILFEAGHYHEDYAREKTRAYVFYALLECLQVISQGSISNFSTEDYFKIPENEKLFFDVVITNSHLINPRVYPGEKIGIRFKEVLEEGAIAHEPELSTIGTLEGLYGHKTYDCSNSDSLKKLMTNKTLHLLVSRVTKENNNTVVGSEKAI